MCKFSIPFDGSADEILMGAGQQIANAGGVFNRASVAHGDFSIATPLGKVEGTYKVRQQSFDIEITDKPFFVSCDRIEKELRDRLK